MAASFLGAVDDSEVDSVFSSRRYIDIMQKFNAIFDYHNSGGVDHPDLMLDCYELSLEIDREIVTIHYFIRDYYLRLESPELDSLIHHHPIDFARLVKNICYDNPPTLVSDLEGLGSEIVIVFSSWRLGKAIEACDRAIALDSAKKKVLDFVESRVGYVAPNLCALVGNEIAVKLIGPAGGLSSLGKMHESYVLQDLHHGANYTPSLWTRVNALAAQSIIEAASVDSSRQYPSGVSATHYRELIRKLMEKYNGRENM